MPTIDERARSAAARVDVPSTLRLAQELVRIASPTGIEGRAVSDHLADFFRSNGIEAVVEEVAPGRANVCAFVRSGEPGPRLMMNGHLDTKPFDGMTIDPLGAEMRDGRMWGRGACDMKSAIAAAAHALIAVKQAGGPARGTLMVGCEVGEEGGGWTLPQLLDGVGACDALLCCEPTRNQLHVGSRGGYPLTVRTRGVATHTGMAYTGVNAVEKMATVITALYALPEFHEVDPVWGRAPINAERISGGGNVTASLPELCEVKFDIRLNPGLPPERIAAAVEQLFERLRASDPHMVIESELRWAAGQPAQQIARTDALFLAANDAVAAATGAPAVIAGFPGGCSGGVALRRGIPGLIIGPGDLAQAHTVDEWIDLEQIGVAARIYADLATRYLS